MTPSKIINFKELNMAIGKNPGYIRRGFVPKKYEELISHLTRSIEYVVEEYLKNATNTATNSHNQLK